jgi:hypothetical protein
MQPELDTVTTVTLLSFITHTTISKKMLGRGRSQTDSAQQGFFLAEFPDKSRVVYIKEKDARFPLQFGR